MLAAAHLRFNAAEQHDQHDNEPSPVFAMYAMDKYRVVVSVHKDAQSLGYLLLALSQQQRQALAGKAISCCTQASCAEYLRVESRPEDRRRAPTDCFDQIVAYGRLYINSQ